MRSWCVDDEAYLDNLDWLRRGGQLAIPSCDCGSSPVPSRGGSGGARTARSSSPTAGGPAGCDPRRPHPPTAPHHGGRTAGPPTPPRGPPSRGPAETLEAGDHQRSVGVDRLDTDPAELTFRFNRRPSTDRGLLFHRLMTHAAQTHRPPPAARSRQRHRRPAHRPPLTDPSLTPRAPLLPPTRTSRYEAVPRGLVVNRKPPFVWIDGR